MFLCISDVIDGQTLKKISGAISRMSFQDGARTAGWHARNVKRNEQAVLSSAVRHVQDQITQALRENPIFNSAVLPLRVAPPMISHYVAGNEYGPHVDDAIMRLDPPLRSDVSVTVFLNDPSDYEGGELVAETLSGEDTVKLGAGSAVIYPSTTLHHVAPVTSGERMVAVTWAQSMVRDADARVILFELDQARRDIFAKDGKCRTFDLITKSYSNLLRRWAEL